MQDILELMETRDLMEKEDQMVMLDIQVPKDQKDQKEI